MGTSQLPRKKPDKVLFRDAVADDDPFGTETTNDLHELLAELNVGYEHRLAAFRVMLLESIDPASACINGAKR